MQENCLTLRFGNAAYTIDLADGREIAIPVNPRADLQIVAFGREFQAKAELVAGGIAGGEVGFNCDEITFLPHINGTHIECVGHIDQEHRPLNPGLLKELRHSFLPAVLISVKPQTGQDTLETYRPDLNDTDMVITAAALERAFSKAGAAEHYFEAVIIRTLPNDEGKKGRDYTVNPSAFLTNEAMEMLARKSLQHLAIDTISVDRAQDNGLLTNHHIWWNVQQGSHAITEGAQQDRTITEMIYVPNDLTDEFYVLNLQAGNFEGTDAIPVVPTLFKPQPC